MKLKTILTYGLIIAICIWILLLCVYGVGYYKNIDYQGCKYKGNNINRVRMILDLEPYSYWRGDETLPYENDTFDILYSEFVIGHKVFTREFMEELYRISKNNSLIYIKEKHFSSFKAFDSETHSGFRWKFADNQKRYKVVYKRIIFGKRVIFPYEYIVEPIVNFWKFPQIYEQTFLRSLFPAHWICYTLQVIK